MVHDYLVRIYARVVQHDVARGADLEARLQEIPEAYREAVRDHIREASS